MAPHDGVWRLDAEPHEREQGLHADRDGHLERDQHDDERDEVRQELLGHHAERPESDGAGRLHELALAKRQDLAANDAGEAGPVHDHDRQDDLPESQTQDRHQRDGQENGGDRHPDVHDAHQHGIDAPADVASDHRYRDTDQRRDDRAGHGDDHRHARAPQEAREDVTAQAVGAERVAPRPAGPDGRLANRGQLLPVRVVGRDERARQGDEQ